MVKIPSKIPDPDPDDFQNLAVNSSGEIFVDIRSVWVCAKLLYITDTRTDAMVKHTLLRGDNEL